MKKTPFGSVIFLFTLMNECKIFRNVKQIIAVYTCSVSSVYTYAGTAGSAGARPGGEHSAFSVAACENRLITQDGFNRVTPGRDKITDKMG